MFKKLLLTLGLGATLSFGSVAPAMAADVFGACSQPGMANTAACKDVAEQGGSGANPVLGVFHVVVQVLTIVIGGLAIIMLVVSGMRLIASNGDSNAVKSARSGIIYAIIGLVVAALGQVIVSFVLSRVQQ